MAVALDEQLTHIYELTETNTDYNRPGILRDDIALVKLAKRAQLNRYVQTGCLPHPDELFEEGQLCSVAGWGLTKESESVIVMPLRYHGEELFLNYKKQNRK